MSPRWRKVIKDLIGNKTRTVLVILAIAVGVFAVGMISGTRSIIVREMDRTYEAMNASSGIIYTGDFDDDMVAILGKTDGVAEIEGRRNTRVRIFVDGNDDALDFVLWAIGDFDDIQLDKLQPQSGAWPPGERNILIERASLDYLGVDIGSTVTVRMPDGIEREIGITGTAYDPNVPAASLSSVGFGYIEFETLAWLGESDLFDEVHFTVDDGLLDEENVRIVGEALEDRLQRTGRGTFLSVQAVGEHWAKEIVDTLLLLLAAFGILTLFLSGILVVNTISAVLTQHVKQIGIMKTIGARRPQIMMMYLVMVVIFGVLSLGIAVPLGVVAASLFVDFIAGLVNIDNLGNALPRRTLLIEIAVGLAVPVLAALWPVIKGVQITIQQALNSIGLGQGVFGRGLIDRGFVAIQSMLPFHRPLLISLRNTIRRKGRLVLTLLTLILGAAIFISVFSVRDSLFRTIDDFLRYRQFDVAVVFNEPYRVERLERVAYDIPGVVDVEGWGRSSARRVRDDGVESDGYDLFAPPPATTFIDPIVLDGRWLIEGDTTAVVINSEFTDVEPDIVVGDMITLSVDDRETEFTVVGLVSSAGDEAAMYMAYEHFGRITRTVGTARRIYVKAEQHGSLYTTELMRALNNEYQASGFDVSRSLTASEIRDQVEYQFNILIRFLLVMAVLLAVVGGLGLTATMSINVLERVREIGVMRAIGASDGAIRQIVLVEGVLIGFISWVIGALISVPFSQLLSDRVGALFLNAPLSYTFSRPGLLLWFIIVMILSVVASVLPAWNASRVSVHDVLAYE